MSRLLIGALAVLALRTATPILAKPEPKPVAPMSADEAAAVQLALNRAQQLYAYDQAAWHTTDALTEDIPKPVMATIRGWVVTPDGDDFRVTYYSGDPGADHRAVYWAVWTGGTNVRDRTVRRLDDNMLSAEETRLAAASDAVPEQGPLRCAKKRFNRVVLPSSDSNMGELVYLLTPQTDLAAIPLGGHHRVEVSEGKILSQRPFTNSCINLPLDKKAEALVISHLLDLTPTEIHFFSAFAAKKPIYVITSMNGRTWAAEISAGKSRVRVVE